jgi:carotenoid cleavage dioxygenase-like enzyme
MVDHSLGLRSLTRETTMNRLPVEGRIPEWLSGDLVRVTPAQLDVGGTPVRHWFDGLAMLNKFSLRSGEAGYANRFLDTESRRAAARPGASENPFQGFATDPCRHIFRRLVTTFSPKPTDNTNVNLARIGDEYIAMTEAAIPVGFDRDTLATLGRRTSSPGQITSAHPHLDPATGELINYASHVGRQSTYRIYGRAAGDAVRVIGEVPTTQVAYMHSFAMTERYFVLVEFPLLLQVFDIALGRRSFIESFRWHPERGARFLVLDRRDGRLVSQARSDAFFAFHHVNAFEHGDELVLDLAAYPDSSVIDALYLEPLRAGGQAPGAELRRYRMAVAGGEITSAPISPAQIELPRIDDARDGLPYRFAYGVSRGDAATAWFDELIKIDTEHGSVQRWHEPGCYPGEPVFAADPSREEGDEDAGVLLSVVLDADRGASFLLVLDARTMVEVGRARAPHAITFGFHGDYFPCA